MNHSDDCPGDCWGPGDRCDGDESLPEPGEYDDREPSPDFGCACENALIVDTTCEDCIRILRERDAETEATPGAIPSREMADMPTVCASCGRPIPSCTCNRRRPL